MARHGQEMGLVEQDEAGGRMITKEPAESDLLRGGLNKGTFYQRKWWFNHQKTWESMGFLGWQVWFEMI